MWKIALALSAGSPTRRGVAVAVLQGTRDLVSGIQVFQPLDSEMYVGFNKNSFFPDNPENQK